MTSNRSTAATRSAAQRTSAAETPRDAVVALARHTAQVEIAAVSAARNALGGWSHAADRFAQAIADELLRRVDRDTDSRELIVGIASAAHVHSCELTQLPSAAANHFDTRLARVSINQ
jgi:hypothetical protein